MVGRQGAKEKDKDEKYDGTGKLESGKAATFSSC